MTIDTSYSNIYRVHENLINPIHYINDAQLLLLYTTQSQLSSSFAPPKKSLLNDSSYTQICRKIDSSANYKFIHDANILISYANSIQVPDVSYNAPSWVNADLEPSAGVQNIPPWTGPPINI